MGTARTQERHCRRENVTYTELRAIQDISDQHVNNVIDDLIGAGVVTATIAPAGTGVGIEITGFVGYSSTGHAKKAAQSDIDLTAYKADKWVSIFATPAWLYGDNRLNGANEYDYHERTETVTFSVVQGTATHLPANPGGGAIRVCSIKVLSTMTVIEASDIKTTGSLNGTNYADVAVPTNEKVSKAGDTITGTLFYQETGKTALPMPIFNFGNTKMPVAFKIDGSPAHPLTGDENFDWHWFSISPMIPTGIARENLKVLITPNLGFYKPDGTIATLPIQPLFGRFQKDLEAIGENGPATEGIWVHYETTVLGAFTGRFCIIIIGTDSFVNRFANRQLRWTAIASQAAGSITGQGE